MKKPYNIRHGLSEDPSEEQVKAALDLPLMDTLDRFLQGIFYHRLKIAGGLECRRDGDDLEVEADHDITQSQLARLSRAVKEMPGISFTIKAAIRPQARAHWIGYRDNKKAPRLVFTFKIDDPAKFGRFIAAYL